MGILLDTFKKDLNRQGAVKAANARKWLFNKVQDLKFNRSVLFKQGTVNNILIGQMFFFFYDPKHKETLPYYDRFPLVIPIEQYPDGFLGLNLHYLDPALRILLLDKLSEFANNKKMDKTTKLKLSYDLVSNASKLRAAAPCIKRYLYDHIQSRFINIEPEEWDLAAFLPVEMFVGEKKQKVWKESRNRI